MRARTRTAVCSLALSLLLVLPSVAQGQRAVGELVGEINEALARNPSPNGAYQLRLESDGVLVAEQRDGTGVISRWEMYLEDIGSVSQTRAGQAYLECADDLGRCVRHTCNGVYVNFAGCVRNGSAAVAGPRYSDALELQYAYDTRALRSIASAFDELLMHDLGR